MDATPPPPLAKPGDSPATRPSLLARLQQPGGGARQEQDWRDFHDLYQPLLLAYARKHGLNEADAKDVAQKTLIRISKSLPAFVYEPEKHRFKAWLFTLAYRGLSDHWRQCRRLRPELPFPDVVTQEATDADPLANLADPTAPQPDATWDKIWQESMLQAALQRVKDRVRPAIMELYQYHVVEEHSVEVTVAEFRESGVTKEQVYLAKSRVLAMLEEELRKLRREFED